MSTTDDLPWPELGNVSRGATRGNQGQKGVLGPPDHTGRCVLQLRVQPGVLAVKLNRQASEWYRTLDNEVNRALKSTKTYWRKARRRQDYDARADQDHMELHEWLQQLKDKTMSHLELLMQKGDIQGPPYLMPDDVELTFLRKFIERQAANIPHNPRLRNSVAAGEVPPSYGHRDQSSDSFSPEPSDHGFGDPQQSHPAERQNDILSHLSNSRASESPSLLTNDALVAEANSAKQTLQASRVALQRAQKETQDSFMRYTSCLDLERQARQATLIAERRRDDIIAVMIQRNAALADGRSRKSPIPDEQRHSPRGYALEQHQSQSQQPHPHPHQQVQTQDIRHSLDHFMHSRPPHKIEWAEPDGQSLYATDGTIHLEDHSRNRKHARTWDQTQQLQENPYAQCETDIPGMPPRKRMHHMMSVNEFDVMSAASLQPQNMSLPS